MNKNFDEALDDLIVDYLDEEGEDEIIAALAAKIDEMMEEKNVN